MQTQVIKNEAYKTPPYTEIITRGVTLQGRASITIGQVTPLIMRNHMGGAHKTAIVIEAEKSDLPITPLYIGTNHEVEKKADDPRRDTHSHR